MASSPTLDPQGSQSPPYPGQYASYPGQSPAFGQSPPLQGAGQGQPGQYFPDQTPQTPQYIISYNPPSPTDPQHQPPPESDPRRRRRNAQMPFCYGCDCPVYKKLWNVAALAFAGYLITLGLGIGALAWDLEKNAGINSNIRTAAMIGASLGVYCCAMIYVLCCIYTYAEQLYKISNPKAAEPPPPPRPFYGPPPHLD